MRNSPVLRWVLVFTIASSTVLGASAQSVEPPAADPAYDRFEKFSTFEWIERPSPEGRGRSIGLESRIVRSTMQSGAAERIGPSIRSAFKTLEIRWAGTDKTLVRIDVEAALKSAPLGAPVTEPINDAVVVDAIRIPLTRPDVDEILRFKPKELLLVFYDAKGKVCNVAAATIAPRP